MIEASCDEVRRVTLIAQMVLLACGRKHESGTRGAAPSSTYTRDANEYEQGTEYEVLADEEMSRRATP